MVEVDIEVCTELVNNKIMFDVYPEEYTSCSCNDIEFKKAIKSFQDLGR